MPTVLEIFQEYEPDLLEMIAEAWGVLDDIDPSKNTKKQLANILRSQTLFNEIIQTLPTNSQAALRTIYHAGGKTPAAQFMRQYGEIREMGAGARGKERPDRNPSSSAEILYYKGLIALSFFKAKNGAMEFIYIPDEFIDFLNQIIDQEITTTAPQHISEKDIKQTISASDEILDQICAFLAASRGDVPADEVAKYIPQSMHAFLNDFLHSQGVIDEQAVISDTAKLKELLLEERDTAFSKVCFAWMADKTLNELRLLPNLLFEGKWTNDPKTTRENILKITAKLPADTWFRFSDVIEWIHYSQPDFQRSGGEYDLWFIKDLAADKFINGFENWQQVEGRLLEYLLTCPLFWMGLIDLGCEDKNRPPTAFKKSKWAKALLEKHDLKYSTQETSEYVVRTNGEILVPKTIQREIRYQIARFCIWENSQANHYRYKLSSTAIERAAAQNISINQVKTIIEKYGKKPIPKNILAAIENWNKDQPQISIKPHVMIRVDSEKIMEKIIASAANQYITERLNPTTAIVASNQIRQLEDTLVKMGIFPEIWHEV